MISKLRKIEHINCPKCDATEDEGISILCWVRTDGKIIEAAGDYKHPPAFEPPQMACCQWCGHYFSPPKGTRFNVTNGKIGLTKEET